MLRPPLVLACLLATALAHAAAQSVEPLRLVTIPWLEAEALRKLYDPTVRLLERKLGTPVEFQIAKDYDEVTQRLTAGAADVAFYGPAGFVRAKAKHPGIRYLATCLLPDDHYFSVLFVRKESPLARLADARGRSIGFIDPQSTSGYLVPRQMFQRAGISVETDARVFLLNEHYRVVDAVAARMVDIGAVESGALLAMREKHGDIFRVVARSAPIPRDPVAAAPHLDAQRAAHIQRLLAQAQRDPRFAAAGGALKGYSVRGEKFYDPIREILR